MSYELAHARGAGGRRSRTIERSRHRDGIIDPTHDHFPPRTTSAGRSRVWYPASVLLFRSCKLLAAIERAIARGLLRQEGHDKIDALKRRVSGLTPRERQVFERVARGRLNKQIAYELGSTERTVKAHRHNLMEKLGIGSLTELVLIAERLGMRGRPSSSGDHGPTATNEQPQAHPLGDWP
jgi:DNA-binding CsgD family transcriptional regulator